MRFVYADYLRRGSAEKCHAVSRQRSVRRYAITPDDTPVASSALRAIAARVCAADARYELLPPCPREAQCFTRRQKRRGAASRCCAMLHASETRRSYAMLHAVKESRER